MIRDIRERARRIRKPVEPKPETVEEAPPFDLEPESEPEETEVKSDE